MMIATVANASTIVTVDLIDEITVAKGPILTMMIGIDVIITATTAAMTDAMTTVAMTTTTGFITVMIAMMIVTTTDVMIDVARMTTIARTATGRSGRLRHHPKGATLMVHSRRLTARSTSSSEVAKQSKAINRLEQTPGCMKFGLLHFNPRGCSYVALRSLPPLEVISSSS
jgi:hypothetical protein